VVGKVVTVLVLVECGDIFAGTGIFWVYPPEIRFIVWLLSPQLRYRGEDFFY